MAWRWGQHVRLQTGIVIGQRKSGSMLANTAVFSGPSREQ